MAYWHSWTIWQSKAPFDVGQVPMTAWCQEHGFRLGFKSHPSNWWASKQLVHAEFHVATATLLVVPDLI